MAEELKAINSPEVGSFKLQPDFRYPGHLTFQVKPFEGQDLKEKNCLKGFHAALEITVLKKGEVVRL